MIDPNAPNYVYTDEQIALALTSSHGNIAQAAQMLKCARNTIYDRVRESDLLKDLLKEEREIKLDWVESKLDEQIEEGNIKAITFFLSTQGSKRGWGQSIVFEAGEPLVIEVAYVNKAQTNRDLED